MNNSLIYGKVQNRGENSRSTLIRFDFSSYHFISEFISLFLLSFLLVDGCLQENVASNLFDATKTLLPLNRNEIDRNSTLV